MECMACAMRSLRLSSRQPTSRATKTLHAAEQQQRNASTARRHRALHRVPPASSFTPSPSVSEAQIIYNPPSTLPNVYHTPAIFLPASDPRRPPIPTTSSNSTQPATQQSSNPPAPTQTSAAQSIALARLRQSRGPPPSTLPLAQPFHPGRKYHLTPSDVEEMRRLRFSDHRTWTVNKLAEKYGCSEAFVRLAAKNETAGREHQERNEEARKRWGRSKREAREDRERRKEGWGMAV